MVDAFVFIDIFEIHVTWKYFGEQILLFFKTTGLNNECRLQSDINLDTCVYSQYSFVLNVKLVIWKGTLIGLLSPLR
jgi:hypothetical protein